MPTAKNIYIHADELENLPTPNRENYLYETNLLQQELFQNARVLQVGSMNGMRIIRLLEVRPDLQITGLELEAELVKTAEQNIAEKGINALFVTGDITDPPDLPIFDYVICLNNTLGYIPNQKKAIEEMKLLGKVVIISVYGEKFNDDLAKQYFKQLNLKIKRIDNNCFIMKDFTEIKRYTKKDVEKLGGKIIDTPIGYFCVLNL